MGGKARPPSSGEPSRRRDSGEGLVIDGLPEALRRELEELGLSPYESRVLLALLQLGSANTLQLARASKVPRTSTYQVLEELRVKRLAQRLGRDGPAVWSCPSQDEVLERLDAAEEDRLRQHRVRAGRVREMLAQAIPENPVLPLPYVQLIFSAAEVKGNYERLFAEAQVEVLVFNRPPYSWNPDQVNPVIAALGRKVKTRVLYQVEQFDEPQFREAMAAYHQAGVEGRVVADLPIKLAVFDRKTALVTMGDPVPVEVGFPTVLLIEHPGFAGVQADAFEHRWAKARSYEALVEQRSFHQSA